MRILIIEDEEPAADRLQTLLLAANPTIQVLAQIDSVEASIEYLREQPAPDLIFLDIQLADGLSFEIFNSVTVETPIIFTTAYDQYAIQAFQVNSIDYLLKPIAPESLQKSLDKFQRWQGRSTTFRFTGIDSGVTAQNFSGALSHSFGRAVEICTCSRSRLFHGRITLGIIGYPSRAKVSGRL